MYNLTGKTYCW